MPDLVGSVIKIPCKDESFEIVTCCQVLEHLPYEEFQTALGEIHRVTYGFVVLSLPDVTTVYRIDVELPRINRRIQFLIKHPLHRAVRPKYDGQHYWEIGNKFYPLKQIISDIKRCHFKIINTYRVFEFYYHRFFLLEKCKVNYSCSNEY